MISTRKANAVAISGIGETVVTTKNGTPLRIRDVSVVQQGPKVRVGIFFVEPANVHDASGATAAAQRVLDAPVTVTFQQTDARQVLDAIFQQVQHKTGARFTPGLFVVGMPSKVSITASAEPAKYVLAKLLGSMYHVPPGMPPPAYLAAVPLLRPQRPLCLIGASLAVTAARERRN